MADLPREMIDEILSSLDRSSLFQASNVCKLWRQQALLRTISIDNEDQLEMAAKNGDRLSIIRSAYNEDWIGCCLRGASERGHKDLIELMITKGANINYGLEGACRGGRKDIVKLMITRGAKNFDWGLQGACEGGHKDLAELMIAKGAKKFNWGLESACQGGHKDLAELMIAKGANDFNGCLRIAREAGHEDLIKLMKDKGGRTRIIKE